MAVHISEDVNGRLILDISEEVGLTGRPEFSDMILAFSVLSRTPTRVVLGIDAPMVESVEYLLEGLQSLNVNALLSGELAAMVERSRAELSLVDRIRRLDPASTDHREMGTTLPIPELQPSATLLWHQIRGLLQALEVGNLAEFSVQGAGKTAIALSAYSIWRSRGEVSNLLVIGPVSCFQPWEDEISRCFGETMHAIRWSGSLAQRMRLIPEFGVADAVLCSYDTAWRDVLMLRQLLKHHPTFLILDESHYVKNFGIGARGTAVLQLAPYAAKRMVMTGTPTPHSLLDLWTQFTFLWPNGSRVMLGGPIQYQDFLEESDAAPQQLRERLSPFFHRTTQDELNLPPAETNFCPVPADATPLEQRTIIRLLEMRVLADARLQLQNIADRAVLAQWQRARVIRLLQAASNPGLLLGRRDWPIETVGDLDMSDLFVDAGRFRNGELVSAKIEWTAQRARALAEQGDKVLIWTWWVENLHLLRQLLADFNPLLLYGAIKPYEEETDDAEEESRERNIREFKTRVDRPVLIANPAACAEAISLHRECHHAIYVDRTYNCGQFLQSLNRIHRVGLPPGTTTHYWIPFLECAVERSVDSRLRQRQQVMYEFLGDGTPVLGIDPAEETSIAGSYEELRQDFQDLMGELEQRD
ncbi:MAG: DEAD/DEAH box helicase [Chloroflexota bacterium]|nr:DEAD/DEAH box helicase [Chloroflexota bacterium]